MPKALVEILEYLMGKRDHQHGLIESQNPFARGYARTAWFNGYFDARHTAMFGALSILFCLMASTAIAQTVKDVPDIAKQEILRRGNHLEVTGTIRSGQLAAALAPPEDDSSKWFITLIVKPGDSDSDLMRNVIAEDKDIRAWIDVSDPARSMTHYQVRSIDDKTQADWINGLKPAIEKFGLPAIVIQPPRNGTFGKPALIVKMIHGKYTGKVLSDKIRDGVVTYVKTIENPISRPGIGGEDERGLAPPFNSPPAPNPQVAPNKVQYDWPPSKPVALTIQQVQDACPGAPPEFIRDAVKSKESDIGMIKLDWLIFMKAHPVQQELAHAPEAIAPPAEECQVNPHKPAATMSPQTLLATIALGMLSAGLLIGMVISSARKKLAEIRDAVDMIRKQKLSQPDPVQSAPKPIATPKPVLSQ